VNRNERSAHIFFANVAGFFSWRSLRLIFYKRTLRKLAYIFGLMILAGLAPAQVYGPLPASEHHAETISIPWAVNTESNNADITDCSTDSLSIAMLTDTAQLDSLVPPRAFYIFNDSILTTIAPASRTYTAEYIELPPPIVHIRQVVDEAEVMPLNRTRHAGWLFTILTLQFVLIVYLRVASIRYAEEQYRSFFNLNISQQVFREQELSMPFPALLLTINGILSYAVLLYLGLSHFGIMTWLTGGTLFLASLAIIFGIAAFKYILMWFTGVVFPFKDEVNFYNFNFFLNIKILGAVLLPINFVIAYAPLGLTEGVILTALGLMAIAYLGLAVKGLAIAKNYLAFHKFHFIVYFCSLEIAPVLLLVKLVMNAAR
jgi:hypothetical protein